MIDQNAGFLGSLCLQIGYSPQWSFPLPEWLPPLTLHFQDWLLAGPDFEATSRLSVQIVK